MPRYSQPTLGAGWMPMQTPAAPAIRGQLPRMFLREAALFGGLAFAASTFGILATPRGWLAILLGRILLSVLGTHRRTLFRTLVEWAGVAALAAVIALSVPHAPQASAPTMKSPVKVEAAQTDQLAAITEQARRIWADAYAQTLGRGATKPLEKPKKEGR